MIPNLKEVYGTSRHFVVISAMKSPYSFQWGIFYTFSSLIKHSTPPPSLHSWPVILFHGKWKQSEGNRRLLPPTPSLQSPDSGLATVTAPLCSGCPCFSPRSCPPLVWRLSSSSLGSAPRLFFPFLLHHCFLLFPGCRLPAHTETSPSFKSSS